MPQNNDFSSLPTIVRSHANNPFQGNAPHLPTFIKERLEATVWQRCMSYTLFKMNNNVNILAEHIVALRRICERECMSMDTPNVRPRSHLFTVRVWEEEIGAHQTEWRGKVQLFTSGEVCYFREWAALVPLLLMMLSESEPDPDSNRKRQK